MTLYVYFFFSLKKPFIDLKWFKLTILVENKTITAKNKNREI